MLDRWTRWVLRHWKSILVLAADYSLLRVYRRDDDEHNMWARLACTIMRRPVLLAAGA